jgi:hypothetical protein
MKTKAYPPILAACALLSAPASAGASTLEVFAVNGTYNFPSGGMTLTGTLSGTFDYNGGVFSDFAITATGWRNSPSQSDLFNVDNTVTPSTSTAIHVLSSADPLASLTLIPAISLALIAPGGSTTFNGTASTPFSTVCMTNTAGGCNEFPVGTLKSTPLPASLPLFAGGLGAMALLRRLRRRTA